MSGSPSELGKAQMAGPHGGADLPGSLIWNVLVGTLEAAFLANFEMMLIPLIPRDHTLVPWTKLTRINFT